MTPAAVLSVVLGVSWGVALFSVLAAARHRDAWRAKAEHWLVQSIEHEAEAAYWREVVAWRDSHPDQPFPSFVPKPFHVGTAALPIITPTGDTARYSTIEDMLR